MSKATLDRIRSDVAELTAHADRRVGSPGHSAARAWVAQRMQELELRPFKGDTHVLRYTEAGRVFANIAGIVPPADPLATSALPIVLGAHYDTVPGTPGADDNAASVAVAFEVAARLRRAPAERPVVIAIFDAEEPPYFLSWAMGSKRFVAEHCKEHVHAAIILDLIGHAVPLQRLEDLVALMGAESHPAWAGVVRHVADGPLPILTVPNDVMPDMSDHHAFRLAGRPYLFVTCGQGPHYHSHTDTLESLDLDKTVLVADLVESLVRQAAAVPLDGVREHDSSELDYELMKRAVSDEALEYFGVRSKRDVRSGLMRMLWLMQENRSS